MKTPADNGRFGASGAVTRPKVSANLQVLHPSERQWKPRLPQAAGTLSVILGGAVRLGSEKNGAFLTVTVHFGKQT